MHIQTKLEDIKFFIMDKAHLSGFSPEDCLGSHTLKFNEGNGYMSLDVEITPSDVDDYWTEKANGHYCLT